MESFQVIFLRIVETSLIFNVLSAPYVGGIFCDSNWFLENKCGALRNLIPFVQFKKREKHPWRSVNFSKVAGFN